MHIDSSKINFDTNLYDKNTIYLYAFLECFSNNDVAYLQLL